MAKLSSASREAVRAVFPATLAIGLVAGGVGGLLGLGGGVVMVPALTELLKLDQKRAHAASLFVIIFTGTVGALSYAHFGTFLVREALWTAMGTAISAAFGALTASRMKSQHLRRFFGAFLILVGGVTLMEIRQEGGVSWAFLQTGPAYFLLGLITGFLSALLGVGGGTLRVPLLVLLFGLPQHQAQGITLAAMIPMALVGTLVYWREGHLEGRVLPGLGLGVLVGAYLGSWGAHLLPAPVLRRIFAAALIFFGFSYMRR